jgi:predicted PurR-regulated permease PerM
MYPFEPYPDGFQPFPRQSNDWKFPNSEDNWFNFYPEAQKSSPSKKVNIYNHEVTKFNFKVIEGVVAIDPEAKDPYENLGNINLFISTDGAKLLQAWKAERDKNAIRSKDISIYLEVDERDVFSDNVMRINVGTEAAKRIYDQTLRQQIHDKYSLSDKQFQQLISFSYEPGLLFSFITTILAPYAATLSYIPKQVSSKLDDFIKFLEKKARVSDKFWNPDHKNYQPKIEIVTDEITNLLDNTSKTFKYYSELGGQLVPEFISLQFSALNTIIQSFNTFLTTVVKDFEASVQFVIALICGIWNAIVDLIIGFIALIKLVIDAQVLAIEGANNLAEDAPYYSDLFLEYTDNIIQAVEDINWTEIFESIKSDFQDFFKAVPSDLERFIKGLNAAELGYYIGYIAFNIAEFFLPILKVAKAAKAGKLPELFAETVSEIQQKAQGFVRQGKHIIGKSKKAAKEGFDQVLNLLNQFISLLQSGTKGIKSFVKVVFEKFKEWLNEMLGRIKVMLLVNGTRQAVYVDFLGVTVVAKLLSRQFANKMSKYGLKMAEYDGLYHVYYKGEKIYSGTAKQVNEYLTPHLKKNGKRLEDSLDGLLDDLVTSQKYWNNFTFDMLMGNPPPPKKPCFAAGTLVSCKTGLKPIEQIEVGENVLSKNMKTGQNEWKTVTETFTNHAEKFVVVELENECIKATGQHTFWVPKANKWTKAVDLKVGDSLLEVRNELKTISSIHIETKYAPTYNLEVTANHNYFVGQNQVLTHNKTRVSKFANDALFEVEFYKLTDINNQSIYIGQTVQGIGKRRDQHVYEGAVAKKKNIKTWKQIIDGVGHPKNFPEAVIINAYEAAVIELYEINLLRAQGGEVYNAQNPIGAKKFKKFKDMGNPCRLYK